MRRIAYTSTVVVAMTLGAIGIASGGGGPFTLTVSPIEVFAGESVTGNGTGCNDSNFNLDSASYQLQQPTRVEWSITGPQPSSSVIASGQVNPVTDPGGSWTTGPVTIPVGTTPGTYHLNATCFLIFVENGPASQGASFQGEEESRTYEPAPFQVLAPASPSPSPSPSPTTEPVEEEPPAEAQPADAVREQPTFTG